MLLTRMNNFLMKQKQINHSIYLRSLIAINKKYGSCNDTITIIPCHHDLIWFLISLPCYLLPQERLGESFFVGAEKFPLSQSVTRFSIVFWRIPSWPSWRTAHGLVQVQVSARSKKEGNPFFSRRHNTTRRNGGKMSGRGRPYRFHEGNNSRYVDRKPSEASSWLTATK